MSFIQKIFSALNIDKSKSSKTSQILNPDVPLNYNERNDCYKILAQQKELFASEVNAQIDKINELAVIANKTTDRAEFYDSVEEIESILTELSEVEDRIEFSYPPSANLRDIRKGMDKQIKLLEKRIAEKGKENAQSPVEIKHNPNPYNDYYDRIKTEKTHNLNISYQDVEKYDMKPFDLKKPFVTDGNFTVIELDGENLKTATAALILINRLLSPYSDLYKKPLPTKITVDYILNQKLPYSHLRLNPYTHSHTDKEYPLLLWLSYFGYYGNEYLYRINFDKEGKIGNCDLQFYNYTAQIRKNEDELYVRKISETLKEPPYGTKTLYINKTKRKNSKSVRKPDMNEYDIERYARECNAYVVREERKENNN